MKALGYLAECEAAGDFDDFSVDRQTRWWTQYYLAGQDWPET